MIAQLKKLQGLHVACAAMIAIAWAVAGVGVFINAKNGQRLSIDVDGSNLNWWVICAISIAPVAAMSWSGLMSRAGKRRTAAGWFVLALLLVAVNIWMAGEYLGDQMLGRAEQARDLKSSSKKIADMTNEEVLRSKRDTEERILRAITTSKDPAEKRRLEEQLDRIQQRPLALIAPPIDGPPVGARASWLSKLLGWSAETVQGVTPSFVPLVMAAVELFFSRAGFSQWPSQNSRRFPETLVKLSREEAKNDLLKMQKQGREFSNAEYAQRWSVPPGTASRWTSEFQQEGLTRRVQRGRRKVAVAPRPNGLHVVA